MSLKSILSSAAVSAVIVYAGLSSATLAAGDVILKLLAPSGEIIEEMDLDALQELPQTTFVTKTIWTDGDDEYTGVALNDLLTHFEVDVEILEMTALNDYSVQVPASDATVGGPIVAFLKNGETMSVRTKGPLWLIYPFDDEPNYQSEEYYSRSIWQLDRITLGATN